MSRGLLAVIALAALCGCGKSNEKAFNDSFDKNFRSSCLASASKDGVPALVAGQFCDCAIAKVDQKYSAIEKLTVSDEQLTPIITECVNSVVQK